MMRPTPLRFRAPTASDSTAQRLQTVRFMHAYRSHTCGALRASDAGSAVRLSGWVHRKRDHGGVLFIDLRDHYGLTQLVLHPETPGFAAVERLRAESVIKVDGEVVARDASVVNPNLPTGEVEVRVQGVEVLSEAAELPMPVFGDQEYPEDIRLANRFLDLRRERLHKNIVLRSKVISSIRRRMSWKRAKLSFLYSTRGSRWPFLGTIFVGVVPVLAALVLAASARREPPLRAVWVVGASPLVSALFLDEPTLGMDVEARRSLWQQVRQLKQQGVAVVLTTHYLEEAEQLADRILVLNNGQIIAQGSPAQLKAMTAYKFIQCCSTLDDAQLKALPAVQQLTRLPHSVVLQSNQVEQTLRALLAQDSHVTDIEVRPVALEQAFLKLTQSTIAKEQ